MKQAEAKRIEKERNEKYQKLKGDAKDERAKYREKYKLDNSPDPSDAEDESDDDDEEDGFGARKKEEDLDPAASKSNLDLVSRTTRFYAASNNNVDACFRKSINPFHV